MFGGGVYVSSKSSSQWISVALRWRCLFIYHDAESDGYSKNTISNTKCVMMSNVAVGRSALLTQAAPHLKGPPPGFDSVSPPFHSGPWMLTKDDARRRSPVRRRHKEAHCSIPRPSFIVKTRSVLLRSSSTRSNRTVDGRIRIYIP